MESSSRFGRGRGSLIFDQLGFSVGMKLMLKEWRSHLYRSILRLVSPRWRIKRPLIV